MRRHHLVFTVLMTVVSLSPIIVSAQASMTPDTVIVEKAQVIAVTDSGTSTIPGTGADTQTQTLKATIVDGVDKGRTVTFTNDYTPLAEGDFFFIQHQIENTDNIEYWSVSDPYRLNVLMYLSIAFVALLILFGGVQGIRGLVSLAGSILFVVYALLPGILAGYSPVLVSIGVASAVIIIGSYITHGFNRTTSVAVGGMILTVIVTGICTYWVIHTGHFTGYTSEENVYLNLNMQGHIDLVGLLFGGIMIGLLGVLYDIAISQAIVVEELYSAGTHLSRFDIYRRAIRIGREHIGALVNTLAIAYVGVALPLLLLLTQTYSKNTGVLPIINGELFATEIVRILIGGIGVIIAVPITTILAVYVLQSYRGHGSTSHSHHHH